MTKLILLLMAVFLTAHLLAGCAPRLRCRVAMDPRTGREIEVCERAECRDLLTQQFTGCP